MWHRLRDGWLEILNIQKFRRIVSYTGFYCFTTLISYAYCNNTTRAGYSRADQFYASYPAGTELLTDTSKLYKTALGNCFEIEEWGPIEWSILAKHFERQGKSPYAYHAIGNTNIAASLIQYRVSGSSGYIADPLRFFSSFSRDVAAIYGTPGLPWAAGWKRLAEQSQHFQCDDVGDHL